MCAGIHSVAELGCSPNQPERKQPKCSGWSEGLCVSAHFDIDIAQWQSTKLFIWRRWFDSNYYYKKTPRWNVGGKRFLCFVDNTLANKN